MCAGSLILLRSVENPERSACWASVRGIFGALDLPIIYKSVEWWRGLHPKVLKVSGGQGLDPVMGKAFGLCLLTFVLFFFTLLVKRCRVGSLEDQVQALTQLASRPPIPSEPA